MEFGRDPEGYLAYLGSGHFIEAVFENWESEFLQMGAYVLLTAFLVQKGWPESKPIDDGRPGGDPDNPDAPGAMRPDSPWPVRRGGWVLKVYENSLSIALLAMFVASFVAHLLGGTAEYNEQRALQSGAPPVGALEFLQTSEFWFQSMQNFRGLGG